VVCYEPFKFECPLAESDVEISADMFIITAEEARKHIEPPVLSSLELIPHAVSIEPGKTQRFIAKGRDQHGNEMVANDLQWTATGGITDSSGVFIAGDAEGSFEVRVTSDGISATASVSITQGGGPPIPPPPKPGVQKISWAGEIPVQKWMNYYMKVLARYATEKDLKLTLSFEVSPEGGVSTQKIEGTKAALRELGLNDDIGVR
jgi:hypothetical protein